MKKRRTDHAECGLSNLPDDCLAKILSHMPTIEAIGTSCLSSRWRNLWKFVEGLDISFKKDTPGNISAASICKLLSAIRSSKLSKLHVKGTDDYSYLNTFVLDGENLIIEMDNSSRCVFPIKYLVRLQIHRLKYQVTPSYWYSLPLLQTIVLDSMNLNGKTVEGIICQCHSLVNLYVRLLIYDHEKIKISHSKLRILVVLSFVVVELHAPALKYLEVKKIYLEGNHPENDGHVFMDVPSLAMCVIHNDMNVERSNSMPSTLWKVILNGLHHVRTIHLGHRFIQGLSMDSMTTEQLLGFTSIFIKITISRKPLDLDIDALAKILPVFSGIEKLTLVIKEEKFNRFGYSTAMKPLVNVLSEFQQLKEVEVHGFIFGQKTNNHPDAARTLFCNLAKKLKIPKKFKMDGSSDGNKFGIIMDDYIHEGRRNFFRAGTFENVMLPSSTVTTEDICLSVYKN